MTNQSLRRWMPLIMAVFVSIFLVAWAVDQEAHIQGSVFLPGGFPFQAYLPGRYTIYCDMDLKPKTEFIRVANMKSLPRVICDVRGAGHLSVLTVPVWHSGGLNRYIRSAFGDNSIRLLVPFAEFDILWPGTYEIRATYNGLGSGYFLMSLGPTSVVFSALLISILLLLLLFIFSFRRKNESDIGQRIRPKSILTKLAPPQTNMEEISTKLVGAEISNRINQAELNDNNETNHIKIGEAQISEAEVSTNE